MRESFKYSESVFTSNQIFLRLVAAMINSKTKRQAGAQIDETDLVVPTTLRDKPNWVCNQGKVPKAPQWGSKGYPFKVDPTDQQNWTDFHKAWQAYERAQLADSNVIDGVGIVLGEEDNITVIDIDDCVDPETGEIDRFAEELIEQFDSFTELSRSGTGIHIYVLGTLNSELGNKNQEHGLEMYDRERSIAFTGKHLEGTPLSVNKREKEVRKAQREYLSTQETERIAVGGVQCQHPPKHEPTDGPSDEQVRETAFQHSEKFRRLWNGDDSMHHGDTSSADIALLNMLVFWTRGNKAQMDRLFRQSERMREKWDSPRGSTTWGDQQLDEALRFVNDHFKGTYKEVQ